METGPDHRELLLKFIASLTLCDHMGDVSNDVLDVLKALGIGIDDADEDGHEWGSLPRQLHQMGITTLHDTEVWSPTDEDGR